MIPYGVHRCLVGVIHIVGVPSWSLVSLEAFGGFLIYGHGFGHHEGGSAALHALFDGAWIAQ